MNLGYMTLRRTGRLLLMLAAQILILNHVHFLGYCTPLLMGYMILCFNSDTTRISLLLWGFATGLIFDIFSNTMGIGAASCTLLAMIQPRILKINKPRDEGGGFAPTLTTMGLGTYTIYTLTGMAVLHTTFYMLEIFNLANFWLTIGAIIGGTVISTLIVLCIQLISLGGKKD